MKYFSTRGAEPELSFEETVLTGLAPDGGLYIPAYIPQLPDNWERDWADYTFQQLSVAILSLYISPNEISRSELEDLVQRSYKTFRHPDVVPLKKLDDNLLVLELFHGPTFAFKDVALQFLGNLFEFFLERRNRDVGPAGVREKLTVLGATSGDTGSAAIYGLRNKKDISIFILHPKGRVSPIQEAQMTTVLDLNVHNVAVKGTFDDCQDIVKVLFNDKAFNLKHHLGAINSINWARILAQTVYYFSSYFAARRQQNLPPESDLKIQYVVPTGNFGDILAGYYAKRMGLPIAKLVVATNENDILTRFWNTGKYEKVDSAEPGASGGVKETHSPAMDIQVSSNFERLLWYLANDTGGPDVRSTACGVVSNWMNQLKSHGRVEMLTQVERARKDFIAERVSNEETLQTIREFYTEPNSYVADPHTAVGLTVAKRLERRGQQPLQIVLSTAHPAKFSEAVAQALTKETQFNFERDVSPEEFKGLLTREKRVIDVEAPDPELVKRVIEKVAITN